jgi:hypothetical protein
VKIEAYKVEISKTGGNLFSKKKKYLFKKKKKYLFKKSKKKEYLLIMNL